MKKNEKSQNGFCLLIIMRICLSTYKLSSRDTSLKQEVSSLTKPLFMTTDSPCFICWYGAPLLSQSFNAKRDEGSRRTQNNMSPKQASKER
eukprot:m.332392 g.332392  ORF g.332392 m.332392 type:complete len:91 (+) comp16945_c0_seq1:74-346(+)